MTATPKQSKIFFSRVAPFPIQDEVVDPIVRQRCPVEIFQAKRGFEQCKLNFLTSVVESYDAEFRCRGSLRESSTLNIEANNNNGLKDFESDKELDSASMSNSGSGISMVGKKGKVKAFRKAIRRLVSKSNLVQPKLDL